MFKRLTVSCLAAVCLLPLLMSGSAEAAPNPGLPVTVTPEGVQLQTLFDADPTGVDKYLAFPTLLQQSDTKVIISYKRGDAHYMESEASLETMIYNPSTGTVTSRTATDQTAGVINQNPELMRMPNGDVYNFVDQQQGGTKTRLGARMFKSTDGGDTFADQGAFPQVGSYRYGYMFDDYDDGGTVYMLAMSFPELTGGARAVHVLKTTDNGSNWTYVKNLTSTFGFAFNESSLEKYGSGYLVIARGDDHSTRLFKTDASFNLVASKTLSSSYSEINYIGRPKLFVDGGNYYLLCRDIQGTTNYLKLYRINPDTLELESVATLNSNSYSAADSYYAEPYFITKSGKTYIGIVTYQKGSSSDQPNIVRYEALWDELKWRLHERFDGMTTGSAPTGWTTGTSGGTVTVENLPAAGDKALKLQDTSASQLVEATKGFASTSGTVELQLNVQPQQTNQVLGVSLTDAAGTNGFTVAFDNNGKMYTYNGSVKTTLPSYTAGTWYQIKIVARTATQKFDVYINGVLAASNYTYRNPVSALTTLRINTTGAGTGTFLADDIVVY
ncbi:hypothetical protein SAMN02799630_03135 [Paenibacillus sp. UNCCL117]|uniref:hypothetical protein n=1 Tax=unclassified Paenibacillus TaxID=185978 RepID=UPI0008808047|nr:MULTISPECIES: hypothetical protein [unclassified Paenibacillus]SDD90544.1 hypothetical protein SAMN04488602_11549 [Paenibacillus sp. cl123]SFW43896.1 hypothetical protein SAMN02799630_03135 [Paenibacillus sp. UNCCL117]